MARTLPERVLILSSRFSRTRNSFKAWLGKQVSRLEPVYARLVSRREALNRASLDNFSNLDWELDRLALECWVMFDRLRQRLDRLDSLLKASEEQQASRAQVSKQT
jgi:hypothetical protein